MASTVDIDKFLELLDRCNENGVGSLVCEGCGPDLPGLLPIDEGAEDVKYCCMIENAMLT